MTKKGRQLAEQPEARLDAEVAAATETSPEALLEMPDTDTLLNSAREKLQEEIARIIHAAVSMSRTADLATGAETITARDRKYTVTITREVTAGKVRVAMTTLPRNRGHQEWTLGGTNQIDDKGRIFIPAGVLKKLTPAFTYREMNPTGRAPVIILTKDRITPTDKLIGPTPLAIDNARRITLPNFSKSDQLTAGSELSFHIRGDMIIVLPASEPEPDWELMDKFVHPEN